MRTKKYLAVKSPTGDDVYWVSIRDSRGSTVDYTHVRGDTEADKFIECFKDTRFKWPWQKIEVTVVYA